MFYLRKFGNMKELKIQFFLSKNSTSNNEFDKKIGPLEREKNKKTTSQNLWFLKGLPADFMTSLYHFSHVSELRILFPSSLFDIEFPDKKNCIFSFLYFQNSWSNKKNSQLSVMARPACTRPEDSASIVAAGKRYRVKVPLDSIVLRSNICLIWDII